MHRTTRTLLFGLSAAALLATGCNDDFVVPALEADALTERIDAVLALDADVSGGDTVYAGECIFCHPANGDAGIGTGLGDFVPNNTDDTIATAIIAGKGSMPAIALEDQEIAGVIAYVRDAFDGDGAVTDDTDDTDVEDTRSTSERLTDIAKLTGNLKNGDTQYGFNCVGCHPRDGSAGIGIGLAGFVPGNSDDTIATAILDGKGSMPAFDLTDQEVADVLVYLNDSFDDTSTSGGASGYGG